MEGYPKLAVLQAAYPELCIYRRFSTLNARNLLYLQAELVDLEEQLDEYTLADIKSDDLREKKYSRNWHYLSTSVDGVENSQWYTMLAIREKLREYNEFLLQQRQLAAFDTPEEGNLKSLQRWLASSERGGYPLTGADRNVWKDGKDLLITCPDHSSDAFTRLLPKRLIKYYHRFFDSKFKKPTDEENGMYIYDEKHIIRAADIIGTLIASLMPVVAVIVLYSIHNMWVRLGMIALFTVLLSLALIIITKGRRIEIFAATAAFASVQVVFVGSTSI